MHNIKIIVVKYNKMKGTNISSEVLDDSIYFDDLDDTKKIFTAYRAMYYALENEGADYSITLVNDNEQRLCRASRCDNVIMYAYNKALLPVNILATIQQ